MVGFIQKFRIVFILVACGLTLLGFAAKQPVGFIFFSIPGILLGLLVFLTNPDKTFKVAPKAAKSDGLADELLKWHQLKENGVISEQDFEKKKLELLG